MSAGGIALVALFILISIPFVVRLFYNFRNRPDFLVERTIRNLAVIVLLNGVAFSLGVLFWAMEQGIVVRDGQRVYDVPEGTKSILDIISWSLLISGPILYFIAHLMRKRRLNKLMTKTVKDYAALEQEYGPDEARKIADRTGLFGRFFDNVLDDF